jgi:hypothetical protein
MKSTDNRALGLFLLALVLILGGLPFVKGGFYIGKHEGDTLHMAEIVLRIARGEWPHLDFMTPIGYLAMAPIAWFVKAGLGLGHAIFAAQAAVALALVPAAMWAAHGRIGGWAGWAYAAFVVILCTALVHGEAERSVSISMHYNRWAWAVAYVVLPLVMLPPRGRQRPAIDGVVIGLGMAALVLTKATYFIALAPAVLVALVVRRWWRTMGVAALAGLVVALAVTLAAGVGFWPAYVGDLLTVAGSEVRAQPGEDFGTMVSTPAYLGASLTMIAAIIFLRQGGRMAEGMILLILAPGLFYIVYQNFGNDPQWLVMLAAFAWVLRPEPGVVNRFGWDMRRALGTVALLALTFGFPSAVNLAYSQLRHLTASTDKTKPLIAGLPEHHDIFAKATRIYGAMETHAADAPGGPFEAYREFNARKDESVLNGEILPYCEQQSGPVAWFETVAKDLEQAGFAGKRILSADLLSSYWMYGDFPAVQGAAPWYYGNLSGLDQADYIVVPMCPAALSMRSSTLKSLNKEGYTLTEVRRTPVYVLITAKRD